MTLNPQPLDSKIYEPQGSQWFFSPRQRANAEAFRRLHPELAHWSIEAVVLAWTSYAAERLNRRGAPFRQSYDRRFIAFLTGSISEAQDDRVQNNTLPEYVTAWIAAFSRANGREPKVTRSNANTSYFLVDLDAGAAFSWRRRDFENATRVLNKRLSMRHRLG